MSELRRGPTRNHWVIVAPERAERPSGFRPEQGDNASEEAGTCPFCPGNEGTTPREIARVEGLEGWLIRVIPNKHPALEEYGELEPETIDDLYERMNGVGAHEVIIETPDHKAGLPDLPDEQVKAIIDMHVARLRDLMRNPRFRYVLLFKNHGQRAGATLSHSHSQIIATPIVPAAVCASLEIAHVHYERTGRCLSCDLVRHELRLKDRVLLDEDEFVVLAPYASRFPFELTIYPRQHSHDFTTISENARWALARTLKTVLLRLDRLLENVPFNYYLETAPNLTSRADKSSDWAALPCEYHWRIVVMPRLTQVAGFEWGTDWYINPVSPEQAVRRLREVTDTGN